MRKTLFAGLVILLPLVLTIFIIVFLIDLFTDPFLHIATEILSKFPSFYQFLSSHNLVEFISRIIVLVFLCVFILFLGAIARWFFINAFLAWANNILCKIPFIKSIYKTSKDVIDALFSRDKEKKAFHRSALVPFPSRTSYCVGFISGEIPKCCQDKINTRLVPVFVPTAPHPISGYFMLMEEKDVHEIDMTNEEAVKFTVSCGMIFPEKKEVDES